MHTRIGVGSARGRTAARTAITLSLLALASSAGTAGDVVGNCPADLNGDLVVDGADLGFILSEWNAKGTSPADLNGDGIVDGADLGQLLAAWGPCENQRERYSGPLAPQKGFVTTIDGQAFPTFVEGSLDFVADFPPEAEQVFLELNQLTLLAQGVPLGGPELESGGIDLRLEQPAFGTFSRATGEIFIPMQLVLHYALIDELVPPGESGTDAEGFTAVEICEAALVGVAFDTGVSIIIEGELIADVVLPITELVTEVRVPVTTEVLKKTWETIPDCPEARRMNKKVVCIQPVFIGTGPGDATATGSAYATMKAQADTIWAKACIEFEWKAPKYVNNAAYKEIQDYDQAAGRTERDNLRKEVDAKGDDDCIEVYFVEKFTKANGNAHASGDGVSVGGATKNAKVIISDAAVDDCNPDSSRVLAHELGHAVGDCPHTAGTCMKPTGASPNCPGLNPATVSADEVSRMQKGALAKPKTPKEECCATPDA